MRAMQESMERVALLTRALRDPFVILNNVPDDTSGAGWMPIWDWGRFLRTTFPLSCFRPSAYARLNDGDLPTTHPLRAIVRSIIEDEGLADATGLLSIQGVEGLTLALDSRRCALSQDGPTGGFTDQLDKEEDGFRLIGSYGLGFARLLDGPVLATYEEDTEYSIGGYVSPYEDIGLRLVQLVEARETARSGSPERREASAELKRFLQTIALQTRGRPTDLLQIAVRHSTDEGEQLVALVAGVLAEPPELSERTVEVLASFEVPREEMFDWALRLALPMFSRPELISLRRDIHKSGQREEGLNGFPREFAVHLLAHRLRRPVGPIARKTTNGWAAEMMSASGNHCKICGVVHEG